MKTGQFCWNELATTDVNKAKDFYNKLLGWEFSEFNEGEASYTIIQSKGKGFGGIWQIPVEQKEHIPTHWMSYIMVADLAIALDKAKHFGARVMKDITPVGERGRFAIIVDPIGAHIAFWESSKKQIPKKKAKSKAKTATKSKPKLTSKKQIKAKKKMKIRKNKR